MKTGKIQQETINRTKVELKYKEKLVQINPELAINRTKVELKWLGHYRDSTTARPINRTKVELKYLLLLICQFLYGTINRTKVELKFVSGIKIIRMYCDYQSYQSGIEMPSKRGYMSGV